MAEGMESYTPAEALIVDAWGRPTGTDTVARGIDRLIRERLVTGNEIIVMVAMAIEHGAVDNPYGYIRKGEQNLRIARAVLRDPSSTGEDFQAVLTRLVEASDGDE